jgi:hypothetical protein
LIDLAERGEADHLRKFASDLNLSIFPTTRRTNCGDSWSRLRKSCRLTGMPNPNASNADIVKAVASHRDELRAAR